VPAKDEFLILPCGGLLPFEVSWRPFAITTTFCRAFGSTQRTAWERARLQQEGVRSYALAHWKKFVTGKKDRPARGRPGG
jgi:hypothetical protein